MLHVFELTHGTFTVSMIAVVGLLPMILAGLYGGILADAFHRRLVALLAATVGVLSTALLAALTWSGTETIWWLYALSMINSAAGSVGMATRTAIVPRLIPRAHLAAASALNGVSFGLTVMVVPALAGVLVDLTGYGWTYTIDVVLMLSMFLGLWTLPSLHPEGETVRPGLVSLIDGARFLRRAENIRMQYILDIVAMTFAQPLTLFPAGRGPPRRRSGHDGSAHGRRSRRDVPVQPALGPDRAVSLARPRHRARDPGLRHRDPALRRGPARRVAAPRSGRVTETALIVAVCAFLALSGAADNVSSIYRSTMMQAAVPDTMRGHLQGIFVVVVAGGPRVGALYVGRLASLTTLWFPPLLGGFLVISLVAVLIRLHPRFSAYDAESPEP